MIFVLAILHITYNHYNLYPTTIILQGNYNVTT